MAARWTAAWCAIAAIVALTAGLWIGSRQIPQREAPSPVRETRIAKTEPREISPSAPKEVLAAIEGLSYSNLLTELPAVIARLGEIEQRVQQRRLGGRLAQVLARLVDAEMADRSAASGEAASVERTGKDSGLFALPTQADSQAEQVPAEFKAEQLSSYLAVATYEDVSLAIDQLNPDSSPDEIRTVATSLMTLPDPKDREALLRRLEEQLEWLKARRISGSTEGLPNESVLRPELSQQDDAGSFEATLQALRSDHVVLQRRLNQWEPDQDPEELQAIIKEIMFITEKQNQDLLLRMLREKLGER